LRTIPSSQQRVFEAMRGRFLFHVMPAAHEFLLREGTDLKYGARHLKRAIERHLVYPLANLLATEQVGLGDVLSIDWDGSETGLRFSKEGMETLPRETGPASGVAFKCTHFCAWPDAQRAA
jgi:ATP-dependent Clp protease ATP-binding subunit ClpA